MRLFNNAAMRKRSRIAFALLLLGGIAWLMSLLSEPMYKGKRLNVWLGDYTVIFSQDPPYDLNKLEEIDDAVRHMGTNAIPILLRRLRAKDSPLKRRLVALAQQQHILKVKFKSAYRLQQEGADGLDALGADAKYAVPELIKLFEQRTVSEPRDDVAHVLGHIGPAAKEAVPALVRSLGDTVQDSHSKVILALGRIHSQPEIVVPALIKCLSDADSSTRWYAAQSIEAFGSDAKAAVPDLLTLLADPNEAVKKAAGEALKQIDPEAAAKAVKEGKPEK
jgi:HEAT repeat protein